MNEPIYFYIDDFLSQTENNSLLNFAIANQNNFQNSSTSTNAPNFRESKVLYDFSEFSELIVNKLRPLFNLTCNRLKLTPFEIEGIEIQLTASNHGDYFKLHRDNGSELTKARQITYVYYFHQMPQAFNGGELEICQFKMAPTNNRIVFFPSGELHQVLPVICPNPIFENSRFTVNGWIRSI